MGIRQVQLVAKDRFDFAHIPGRDYANPSGKPSFAQHGKLIGHSLGNLTIDGNEGFAAFQPPQIAGCRNHLYPIQTVNGKIGADDNCRPSTPDFSAH